MGGGVSALRVCADHRGGINWLSLSPDGQRLLTGSEDGTARLWSTADGQCCALFQGHESYVTFCQLESEAAFTCSADHTVRKWDVLTGQCLAVYRGHTSIVNRILVADRQLFSSSYDRTARCWSVDKEQMSREFRGHRNCVLPLAYSAPRDLHSALCERDEDMAGGLLVTGSTDGTAKVWQVASGCCHRTLRGHTGAVLCLALDTPGHTAFTGSTDATVRAWDILSGEQLRVFREHQGSVICLECLPAVGTPVPAPSTPSLECCRGCSVAMPSSSTASRCTSRCSTRPPTTARCASGTCAGSASPAPAARFPSAAARSASTTGWAAQQPRRTGRPRRERSPAGAPRRPAVSCFRCWEGGTKHLEPG
ncbi:WD repeat-containing protein 86 isoform X2 [Elephas maximus indicus]|uniref:WD repeat-containing protein 86 isoform X2 n=1 Tax=Elephas maximus indicus TaxID=99487 RepID=UPI0021163574|nr:WD repeat-containing protein 86 isoform X2 [Elephas maximus indicus]